MAPLDELLLREEQRLAHAGDSPRTADEPPPPALRKLTMADFVRVRSTPAQVDARSPPSRTPGLSRRDAMRAGENSMVRVLMRQEKTMKIICNHVSGPAD